MMEQVLYTDRQFLGSPIVWVVIILAAGLAWWDFYRYFRSGGRNGIVSLWHRPIQTMLAAGVIAPLCFITINLTTVVTPEKVLVRFFPLQMTYREIALEDISDCEVTEYQPVTYGGWGIRGTAANRVYTLNGRDGVKVVLRNGNAVLLGTANSERLAEAINRAREARGTP